MKTYLATVFAGTAFLAFTGMAVAHHSFAMFDQEHPQEVTGVVKEFKYTSPHSFIILDIKDKDGTTEAWNPRRRARARLPATAVPASRSRRAISCA